MSKPKTKSAQYQVGQLVWAKIKGYPHWPAKVVDPLEKPEMKRPRKKCICVQFFGTGDYSFVSVEDTRPFFAFRQKMKPSSKKPNFLQALEKTNQYVDEHPEALELEMDFKSITTVKKFKKWTDATKDDETESDMSDEIPFGLVPAKKFKLDLLKDDDKDTSIIDSKLENHGIDNAKNSKNAKLDKDNGSMNCAAGDNLNALHFKPLDKKIGFIGVGNLGSVIVKRLLATGHDLLLCSRSLKETDIGSCELVETPKEIVDKCDIIFCCLSDVKDARSLLFDTEISILNLLNEEKSFVQLSTLSLTAAFEINKVITDTGAKYLEAPLNGTLLDARQGSLVMMASGDKSVYDELVGTFRAFVSKAFFLGRAVGTATKFRLMHQMLYGTLVTGLSECLAVSDKCGLDMSRTIELLGHCGFGSPIFNTITKTICDEVFLPPLVGLDLLRKEMQYGVIMANENLAHPTPIASTALNIFLSARNKGLGNNDCTAVFNLLDSNNSNGV